MVATRSSKSSSREANSSHSAIPDLRRNEGQVLGQSESEEDPIEVYLKQMSNGVKKFRQELARLREKNDELTAEVERLEESTSHIKRGKGTGPRVVDVQREVRRLKAELQRLERARERDRRRLRAMRTKEIKRDAQELQEDAEDEGSEDTSHKMRKLLRRFHDAMLVNALDEGEECSICCETMEPGKCSSFPCQHTICHDCLPKLKGTDTIECPQCRQTTPRDEMETIDFTATIQWDNLLEIAKSWASIDRSRGEQETSDEEAEEEFIDNGEEEERADTIASEGKGERSDEEDLSAATDAAEDQMDQLAPHTPPPISETEQQYEVHTPQNGPAKSLYSQSTPQEKRKHMEELREQRLMKRRR